MLKPTSKIALYLVFAIMAITSLIRNEVFTGKTNVINWDGYGYYVYLPATFIYGDVEEYAFVDDHFSDYDISSNVYQLMETEDGGKFPIYNIGLAVVWTPVFLAMHAFVKLTGIAPADGMSYPYQLTVVFMSLLIIFLGLMYLRRFLLDYFSETVVAFVLIGLGLGTNLFYYVVEKPDMTHGYLFAGYAAFLYFFNRYVKDGKRSKDLVICGLLAGAMCLTRSSEIVLFAIPAFYGLKNWPTFKENFGRTAIIFGLAIAVFSLQLVFYKVGTGHWFQDGYKGLGFDWLSPHLYEGFFGYRRGWLLYTPLMALGLAGIFWLRKGWFLPVLIFTIGNCYILFSWHIWWYGNTFGSRPVVQSYALLALPLAALLAWFLGADAGAKKGWKKAGFGVLVALFIGLNLFQHWQYNQRIIPLDFTNQTYYWEVFGKTKLNKKDRVFLDTNEKMPTGLKTKHPLALIDTLVSVPAKAVREFTNLSEHWVSADEIGPDTWISASLSFSYHGEGFDKWKFPSVVTEHRRGGDVLKWMQVNIARTVENPDNDSLSFNISLPDLQEGDVVKQYVWNLSRDSMAIRSYQAGISQPGN
ncbi:MAG: hypothetical protein ACJAZ9_001154 [Neolewinella sp.]